MNLKQIKEDIQSGESLHREFKEARNLLPRNLFETVCAFLNTDGGTIFLGVADDGTVTGIEEDSVNRIKSELSSLSNNPQKIDPPFLLFPKEFEIEEKKIVTIQVPLSSQLHKTNKEFFLRSEDGDYRVQGTHQLAGIINRKLSLFTEQRTLSHFTINDLNPDLFDNARRLMRSYNSHHPWLNINNEELLRMGGFYATSNETGKTGLTLASVLLFGNDVLIQQVVPAYKIDCLLRRENLDRYDDRLTIRTNLIDAYDQMMGFIEKHLNDPFYLEGDMRISLRDKIFREAISNIISHREYTSAAPSRLIIYKDKVILDNPSTHHHFGEITPENLRPFSKNPTICKFMIQLGRFDELGSGVTNINKYLPLFAHGAKPVFKETRHGFELIIPLGEKPVTDQVGTKSGPSQDQVKILRKCLEDKGIIDLMAVLKRSNRTKFRDQVLNPLLKEKLIEMTIPDKPKSSKQRYRLTEKGKGFLKGLEK